MNYRPQLRPYNLAILLAVFFGCSAFCSSTSAQTPLDDSYFHSIVSDVCNLLGISTEFDVIRFNDASKSAAFADFGANGEQQININDAFSAAMNPTQYGDAPWKFTIAHEIGHFQNGHISKTDLGTVWFGLITRRKIELQADYFGGYVLALLGLSKSETVSYFQLLTIDFSSGFFSLYPAVEDRINETERGWDVAAQRLVSNSADNGVSENDANSSVSITCQVDGTGDFCFQNQSSLELSVFLSQQGSTKKSAMLLPGQTKCLYNVKSGIYYFEVREGFRKVDYGDVVVSTCKTNSYHVR